MSGVQQEAVGKHHADITDPGRGKHLWTVMVLYRLMDPSVSMDPEGQINLDLENLLTIEGPGCFKCEKVWSPDAARRFCQGSMTEIQI